MKLTHRQASANDIVVGAKIKLLGDDGLYSLTIVEVLNPADLFKAYVADDGCRYGLDGSFVKEQMK